MGRGNKRGRGGGGRGRGRGGGGGGRGGRGGEDNRVSFEKVEKHNEKLERYYNGVLGIEDEEERYDFWAALKRELPNSFRFAGSKGHALAVQKLLKTRYVPEISKISHYDGTPVEPPQPVLWYPDELAWWMTTPKNVIRRFPPFAAFQKFLVSETSVGNISRQEVVSMIPPLVMDLQPGMTVLDMCAAPGSKAAQLLEMVHNGEEARVRKSLKDHAKQDGRYASPEVEGVDAADLEVDTSDNGRATGLLIANDSDYKRSHMLIHQLKRLSSPNLIVTNHDATMYPSIKLPSTPENPAHNRYLKFDRILADVPCSGDGTTRKNANLWKDWNPGNALGLYITQVRILVRALQMLKPGGRVVYSTCSMNPVENEAVIASAIERCGGLAKVQLLPSDDKLPLLKRRPGLKDWSVMDKSGKIWSTFQEVKDYEADRGASVYTDRLVEGMFPPTDADIPFERCMRVYAHLQDTGGFFIAILQKMSEFRAKPESDSKKVEPKPAIISIVDEIESMPPPKEGESVLPKIEAADALTKPQESNDDMVSAAARQNQEGATSDGTLNGRKRSLDETDLGNTEDDPSNKKLKTEEDGYDVETKMEEDADEAEIDAFMRTKGLSTKEEVDEPAEEGMEDRNVHYPPPPGAELDLTTRPGDMRSDSRPTQQRERNRSGQQFEEPFKYIAGDHFEVQSVEKFYHLSPRFPRDRFMVRNAQGEPAKTIYYTSALIRDILTENEGKGIKFIHGGVKMFMKQDVQGPDVCKWRIQSEGMPILEGYVGEERVVRLYRKETFRKLLIEMFPKLADDGWKNLGEIGERVRDIPMGCCVLRIEPSNDEDGFDERMVLPLWRSAASLNLMLAKEDRTAMLLRIFNDTTPLVNNSTNKQKTEGATKTEVDGKEERKPVAPGFIVENAEVKVDTSSAIEAAAPVNDRPTNAEIKPGPYGVLVGAAPEDQPMTDVKAEKIVNGEGTGGPEQQLNGTGGVEGQLGGVS
ncbi:S-adenosyl-L-methionine-dependent methyltransferase [Hyaloscypha variabilis F]|uniref:S-adenosyl-L-methionine-dependent methyltransferase n=1 Tax=Hyaloscypha variabilis (strain UAMH 11265 / GT02V1 / F) TaxID=1149755 RepID=A0A2J6SAH5_HYAVF|nr:S-adenosyl-L-methionine-dependent methyltransferase [Hyaloscypha variabilis F]